MTSKKRTSGGGIGLTGAAALAAAGAAAVAAGYYFYASDDAKKHRKIAVGWAGKLKKEVIKQAKQVQKIDADTVARIVDDAARTYEEIRSIKKEDVRRAAGELKNNWHLLAQELKKNTSPAKKKLTGVRTQAKRAIKKARA